MDESSCCSTFLPEFDVSVLNLGGSDGKGSACNVGDPCSIPGSGSSPGEGNGSPLQWFCLKNSMNREAWQFTVHGIARVRSDWATFTSLLHFTLSWNTALPNYSGWSRDSDKRATKIERHSKIEIKSICACFTWRRNYARGCNFYLHSGQNKM